MTVYFGRRRNEDLGYNPKPSERDDGSMIFGRLETVARIRPSSGTLRIIVDQTLAPEDKASYILRTIEQLEILGYDSVSDNGLFDPCEITFSRGDKNA